MMADVRYVDPAVALPRDVCFGRAGDVVVTDVQKYLYEQLGWESEERLLRVMLSETAD